MLHPLTSFFRAIFSLDTLDARFTPKPSQDIELHTRGRSPSRHPNKPNGPHSDRPDGPSGSGSGSGQRDQKQPPRWKTPEFYVYYLVFAVVIPMMFKVTYDLSQKSHPNYKKYKHLLSDGWIPGRKVDNSDGQYASFRDNIPILIGVTGGHFLLRQVFDKFWNSRRSTPERAAERLQRRVVFDVIFALVFLTVLHGSSIFKILFLLVVNYSIALFCGNSVRGPAITWVVNIAILFLNELCDGYRYATIFPGILAGEGFGVGKALDNWGGLMPRWGIHFNITMLRLVSYNMDYYWSFSKSDSSVMEKKQAEDAVLSERDRVDIPSAKGEYNFINYLAYALYSPLYLAGPIITFNDYISQNRNPLSTVTYSRTFKYFIRLIIAILTMEIILHYLYVVAISKTAHTTNSWAGDTPFQLSMIGYFNLHIIWLKLLIPWRVFRFWALLDGIDPPENMVRCMSNNFSAFGFWRGWHRSYNRWIVRYIYIPIGGGKRPILNSLAVFTFVALWHDISLNLLAWGWLVTLFFIPELLARYLFPAKNYVTRPTLYRHLCAMGAVGNILMMMVANLVGFAIGLDGLKDLLRGILGGWAGVAFFMGACGALFVGAQIMFEVREEEKRAGIKLKC